MRQHPSRYDERIAATLAEHGVLGFSALMTATSGKQSNLVRPSARTGP